MFDKILLPTDGSDVALAAAERAVALARLAGAALHVVFVLEPYPFVGIGATNSAGVQEYLADSHRHATEALARVSALAQVPGVTLTSETVESSSPAEQIVEAARRCGADLIVMGSHGRSGVARVLLGSVAGKVLMLSPVPVMIVK
jgi:nucleotide-binding universal stress UspA family protein